MLGSGDWMYFCFRNRGLRYLTRASIPCRDGAAVQARPEFKELLPIIARGIEGKRLCGVDVSLHFTARSDGSTRRCSGGKYGVQLAVGALRPLITMVCAPNPCAARRVLALTLPAK